MTTVSATGVIVSAGMPTQRACSRCPEPFRLALAQRWGEAAEAFRAHEMP